MEQPKLNYWVDYVARWERVIGRDGKVMYRFKGCTEPVHALDDPTLPTPCQTEIMALRGL